MSVNILLAILAVVNVMSMLFTVTIVSTVQCSVLTDGRDTQGWRRPTDLALAG